MKKSALFLVSALALTSCLESGGNVQKVQGLMGTISQSTVPGQCVVQLDYNGLYYYADEFLDTDEKLGLGTRVWMKTLTLNYDIQPAGVTGSQKAPMYLTEVDFDVIETLYVEDGIAGEPVYTDTLSLLRMPYIVDSPTSGGILTVSAATPDDANPKFGLIYRGVRSGSKDGAKDTIEYDLTVKYAEGTDLKGDLDGHIKCFAIQPGSSQQPVLINFEAKAADANENATDSTFVIFYPKDGE